MPLVGPFVYALITLAGMAFKHASLAGPGDCVQFIAVAKPSKASNAVGLNGARFGEAPENNIAALNGGSTGCRETNSATDSAPADWP